MLTPVPVCKAPSTTPWSLQNRVHIRLLAPSLTSFCHFRLQYICVDQILDPPLTLFAKFLGHHKARSLPEEVNSIEYADTRDFVLPPVEA